MCETSDLFTEYKKEETNNPQRILFKGGQGGGGLATFCQLWNFEPVSEIIFRQYYFNLVQNVPSKKHYIDSRYINRYFEMTPIHKNRKMLRQKRKIYKQKY